MDALWACMAVHLRPIELRVMDPLLLIDPRHRRLLLRLAKAELIGAILRLNRLPRYHNSLDAIALCAAISEHQLRDNGANHGTHPASSRLLPGSST